MSNRPKLSRIVASQLPEFIREDYPTFVAFLESYYEFLETQDVDVYNIRDIDKTLDTFIDYFKNELAPNYNISQLGEDKRFILSRIKDQHLAKGSEASYKLLFRLLFNKNVTVEYPGKQMLRASDGKWNQDVSVFGRVNAGDPNDIVGKLVDVVTPNRIIRVLVDRRQDVEIEVDRFVQISPDTYEFYVDRRFFGDINVGDRLRYDGIFDATIVSTTSAVEIQQKGKNFKVGQLYNIKNGQGSGSILKVKSVDSQGGLTAVEFVKYGIGYDTDFTSTLLASAGQAVTGLGQTALSINIINSGVTSIQITNGGSGYTSTPTVALSGGGFTSQATIGDVIIVGGVITEIKIQNPGSGYVTAPDVIIVGGGGTGADANATIGQISNYGIFESTDGFSEQGYINTVDYAQDTPVVWVQNRAYTVGDEIYWEDRTYVVTTAGIAGTTPPSHTSGSASNGTLTLEYSRLYGAAFDGTYAGDILREFFFDSRGETLDPDEPAIVSIKLGPLTKYPGYFRNNDGFISDAIFIQDSNYYQAYSYVLKIDERLESYKSAVKTLIHPSGLALFGEYDIRNEIDLSLSLQSMVKILVVNVQDQFTLDSFIAAKDFGKAVSDEFEMLDSNVKVFGKSLSDDFIPTATISSKNFNKALTTLTDGFNESTTFTVNKSLESSLIPIDGSPVFSVSKNLQDSFELLDSNVNVFGKSLSDDFISTADISSKTFNKALTTLTDGFVDDTTITVNKSLESSLIPIDGSPLFIISKNLQDSFTPVEQHAITLNKYIDNIDDTTTPVDSGGFISFNPYDEGSYFLELYVGQRITF
jgi:hypothetical protein